MGTETERAKKKNMKKKKQKMRKNKMMKKKMKKLAGEDTLDYRYMFSTHLTFFSTQNLYSNDWMLFGK